MSVLPEMPAGIDAGWLTATLQAAGALSADNAVTQASLHQVGDGLGMMSELSRVQVAYARPAADLPSTYVAKYSSSNPTNREVGLNFGVYEREVRYFAELDALTATVTPQIYTARIEGDNFVILMEDLQAYRAGDQVQGADLQDTELALEELAKLHAAFWNNTDACAWVPGVADSYHADNMANLITVGWPGMVEHFGAHLSPQVQAAGDDFVAAIRALQTGMNDTPRTLLHGDFRMENFFFGQVDGQHPMVVLDWQGPLLGNNMVDVAQMLTQSTRKEVRQAQEQGLIRRYVERLAELGVSGYSFDQAWADYARATLYLWCYVGVVAGTLDSSNPKSVAWMSQMVDRANSATLDLGALAGLPA